MKRKNKTPTSQHYMALLTPPLPEEPFTPYSRGAALETHLPVGFPIPTVKNDWTMMVASIPDHEPVLAITMVINGTHAVNWLLDGSDPAVHKVLDTWLSQGAFQALFYRQHQRTGKFQALVLPLGDTTQASRHLIRYDEQAYDRQFYGHVLEITRQNALLDIHRQFIPTIRRAVYCPVVSPNFVAPVRATMPKLAEACDQASPYYR